MSTTRVVRCVEHDRVAMPLQGRFWCPVSPTGFHPVDKNGERVTEPTRPRISRPSNTWY